jgi:hypothetical protein
MAVGKIIEDERLYTWLNIFLSFARHTPLSTTEMAHLFDRLQSLEVSAPDGILIASQGRTERVSFGRRISEVPQVINESLAALRGKARVTMRTRLRFPFGWEAVRIDYDRWDRNVSLALLVSLESFMQGAAGPYLHDRIEHLCTLSSALFTEGGFLVGLIDVENSVMRLDDEEFLREPPVNWAFWRQDVVAALPENVVNQARETALEATVLEGGGMFWRWNAFGESVETGREKCMGLLRDGISVALRGLPDVAPR